TQAGVAYLSLVTDAYSRKIVGHHVHESLHTESVIQAFSKALKCRTTEQNLVHHSDRGIQYCSELYQRLHVKHGIRCSMTDGYDCYQNALAERVNGILKTEFLLHRLLHTLDFAYDPATSGIRLGSSFIADGRG
ncbi:DDE-type integrase/transposase/recombinase, partial [Klebsiella pneumoniae]